MKTGYKRVNCIHYMSRLMTKPTQLPLRTAKILIRLGGCPGWSESSLDAKAILLVLLWGGSITTQLYTRNALWSVSIKPYKHRAPWLRLQKRGVCLSIVSVLSSIACLVAMCLESAVFLAFRLCCLILDAVLSVLCSFPIKFEPPHDKTNKMAVRPAKTQMSLGSRPVWSESSQCAQWVVEDPVFLHADSEDSDQTGWMPRLLGGCPGWSESSLGAHAISLVLSWGGSLVSWSGYGIRLYLFLIIAFLYSFKSFNLEHEFHSTLNI